MYCQTASAMIYAWNWIWATACCVEHTCAWGGLGGLYAPQNPKYLSQTTCLGKILTKTCFKAFLSDFQTCLRHFSESCPTQIFRAAHVWCRGVVLELNYVTNLYSCSLARYFSPIFLGQIIYNMRFTATRSFKKWKISPHQIRL